jgi:hypothetical protein
LGGGGESPRVAGAATDRTAPPALRRAAFAGAFLTAVRTTRVALFFALVRTARFAARLATFFVARFAARLTAFFAARFTAFFAPFRAPFFAAFFAAFFAVRLPPVFVARAPVFFPRVVAGFFFVFRVGMSGFSSEWNCSASDDLHLRLHAAARSRKRWATCGRLIACAARARTDRLAT